MIDQFLGDEKVIEHIARAMPYPDQRGREDFLSGVWYLAFCISDAQKADRFIDSIVSSEQRIIAEGEEDIVRGNF